MFDTFPFDSWDEVTEAFWTWGPGNSTGTYILTALGIAVMFIAFFGFVILENRKLSRQQARLQAAGALDRPSTTMGQGA